MNRRAPSGETLLRVQVELRRGSTGALSVGSRLGVGQKMRKVADGERISAAQSEESPPASAQKQQCAPEHKAGGRASGGDALLKGLGVALPRGACAGERKLRAVGRNIHSHDISVVDAAPRNGKVSEICG